MGRRGEQRTSMRNLGSVLVILNLATALEVATRCQGDHLAMCLAKSETNGSF